MKKVSFLLTNLYLASVFLVLPANTLAQGIAGGDPSGGDLGSFLQTLIGFVNTILIPFIIGIGFLVFVFGMFRYFIAGAANEQARESGKSLMIYSIAGFVLIIVFWGIINVIASSTGLNQEFDGALPKAPGAA
jgi:hypothetical protein